MFYSKPVPHHFSLYIFTISVWQKMLPYRIKIYFDFFIFVFGMRVETALKDFEKAHGKVTSKGDCSSLNI